MSGDSSLRQSALSRQGVDTVATVQPSCEQPIVQIKYVQIFFSSSEVDRSEQCLCVILNFRKWNVSPSLFENFDVITILDN